MENKIIYYLEAVKNLSEGYYVQPVTCEIDPSNRCNLACAFCMYERSNEDLPYDLYCELLVDLKGHGTKSITFTGGGEPLMHPRFNEMAKEAKRLGFQIGLITNGTRLDQLDNPYSFEFIRVSLDAGDWQTYERVKGGDFFYVVLGNIGKVLPKTKTLGISFVVCELNRGSMHAASELAKDMGVSYIQFKPAWQNGSSFAFRPPAGHHIIHTERYDSGGNLPCTIAHLVGIVGADARVYYCCQHRGKTYYALGDLRDAAFTDIWLTRMQVEPMRNSCPQCRYANYAREYEAIIKGNGFIKHRNFL